MKDELTIRDFYDFLLNHVKILVSTILVAIILTTTFIIYSHVSYEPEPSDMGTTSPIELTPSTISDDRYEEISHWPLALYSEPQIKQMQAYLLPRAYRITIYVEHENYEPIKNTTFMREVFRNKEVRNYIESKLDSELTPAIEFAIHIENLENSGVYELHLQRGTKEESLQLAYIIMDAIRDNAIPVLDNKTVSLITQEPEIIVRDYSEFETAPSQSEGLSVKSMIKDVLIYNVFSVIIAIVIGLIISIIVAVFGSKVSAVFDYAREESDRILRFNQLKKLDANDKKVKVLTNINLPAQDKKVILYDPNTKEVLDQLLSDVHDNIKQYTDFSMLDDNINNIDEVIIISVVNKTEKNWYNNQRLQLKGYKIPIKIIQYK